MANAKTQVLIVGAGPSGLTLALWLARLGVGVRVIDRSTGPGETSRALAVQARTLEFHRQIGIVEDVLAAGVRINRLTVRTPAGIGAALKLADFGAGISRYSFAFALPQDIHEKILAGHLKAAGVEIERKTELVSFSQNASGVTATLRKDDLGETVEAAYICGCDGAHSAVRHGLNIGFPGGAYRQSFYVADVEGAGAITQEGMDVRVGMYGFAIMMPVRQSGTIRLIGVVPEAHEHDESITFDAIRSDIENDTGVKVTSVKWFSTYHVHHRVAEKFRVGRAFIVGDAGHIHSPAGGQGMNTGMGDAVNLAWKLAAVLQGRANASLLDSYEPERIAFARLLIASTDRAFKLAVSRSRLIGFWRRYLLPHLMSALLATSRGSHMFFRMISQTGIHYRASPLSIGSAGSVLAGDRLPWVDFGASDNHACLTMLDWQLHIYGTPKPEFSAALTRSGLPIRGFEWTAGAQKAGFARDAAYLVRPDGHVALAGAQDAAMFVDYIARLEIRPRSSLDEALVRRAA